MSSRTLIFGGTFDPPHRAHVELPLAAARELACDRILYIPAAINPLKHAPTPAQHRLAMLRLALRDVPLAEINETELNRPGPSYTIDTLRALAPSAPGSAGGSREESKPHLLIGADQALDFPRWKQWREILERATPAVMLRPPWTRESFATALRERFDETESQRWLGWTLRTLPAIDISATEIREQLRDGRPVNEMLSPAVQAYIRKHGLYGLARPR